MSLQGSKTKGALKGWGNFGDMTSTPKGATFTPNSSSASKTRPGMDNSAFKQFQEAAKQKADRSALRYIIECLTEIIETLLQGSDTEGAAGDQQEADGE